MIITPGSLILGGATGLWNMVTGMYDAAAQRAMINDKYTLESFELDHNQAQKEYEDTIKLHEYEKAKKEYKDRVDAGETVPDYEKPVEPVRSSDTPTIRDYRRIQLQNERDEKLRKNYISKAAINGLLTGLSPIQQYSSAANIWRGR